MSKSVRIDELSLHGLDLVDDALLERLAKGRAARQVDELLEELLIADEPFHDEMPVTPNRFNSIKLNLLLFLLLL